MSTLDLLAQLRSRRSSRGIRGRNASARNPALARQLDAGRSPRLRPLAAQLGDVTTFAASGQAAGLVAKAQLHAS